MDPNHGGLVQGEELRRAFQETAADVYWVLGNNDWWISRARCYVPLAEHYHPKIWSWKGWLHTFEGGNYPNLPWSDHHDTLTLEQDQQWATLLPLDCGSAASVLASHYPFVWGTDSDARMYSWWEAALQQTNIKKLVFGHLHEEYLDRIPTQFKNYTIQVVSDHRERIFHEVTP